MHRLALLLLFVASSVHADGFEVSGGAGAGVPTDARFGTRAVARLAIGARIDPHVTLSLPLEVAWLSYDPAPDQGGRRTRDYSLALVPEVAVGADVAPRLRTAVVAGFGVGGVGDDNTCVNLQDCDAYNNVVGLKLVGRAAIELRYEQLWVRPLAIENTWGGVTSFYVSAMAGIAL